MGPTVVAIKTEPSKFSHEIAEYIIIESSVKEEEPDDDFNQDQPSSSDGDASLSDDVFSAYHGRIGRRESKENRSVHRGIMVMSDKNRGEYDESYYRRRQRNNAAVKRSRDKARQRQKESLKRLAELTAENRRLHLKADTLLKELSLLRGFFPAAISARGNCHVREDEVELATEEVVLEADTFLLEASQ